MTMYQRELALILMALAAASVIIPHLYYCWKEE